MILEPDLLIRAGLKAVLAPLPHIDILEVTSLDRALERLADSSPDVVLAGVQPGATTIRQLITAAPECPVLAVCDADPDVVKELLESGAKGLVCKQSALEDLGKAIEELASGEVFISTALLEGVFKGYQSGVEQTRSGTSNKNIANHPLLQTKLHRPPPPLDIVFRPELRAAFESGQDRPLTLVSAPAGYGKSIAVSDWLEHADWCSAWVSLDESDADLREFLDYCTAAIDAICPGACRNTADLVTAATLPPVDTVARTFSNDLESISAPILLVLDDYHRIRSDTPVHQLIASLLERPPLCLHLIIVTRRDPPLALVKLRARGQISEFRMKDLVFNDAQSAQLVTKISGLELNRPAQQALQSKLEGWVAGLRLASLALRHNQNTDWLFQSMTRDFVGVSSYLTQEVLSRLEVQQRNWMLSTSVLERFNAELCDVLCGEEPTDESAIITGANFISRLLEQNLFVIPLDEERIWYRYHHELKQQLFRELQAQYTQQQISQLHHRAGTWFAERGLVQEAIDHFLAADDADLIGTLIARRCFAEINADRHDLVDRWLSRLPIEVINESPELLMADAAVALDFCFDLDRVNACIRLAGRFVEHSEVQQVSWLRAQVNFFRGVLDYWSGKSEQSRAELEQAMSDMPLRDGYFEGERHLMLALAVGMDGDSRQALQHLEQLEQSTDSENVVLLMHLIGAQAFLHYLSCDLASTCTLGARINDVTAGDRSQNRSTSVFGDYFQGTAYLHMHSLGKARDFLQSTIARRYHSHRGAVADAFAALALTLQLQGDSAGASTLVNELKRFAEEYNDKGIRSTANSCAARLALLNGNLAQAIAGIPQPSGEPEATEFFFWTEVPLITRMRILIAEGTQDGLVEATASLQQIHSRVNAWRYLNQGIEVGVLLALALHKQGRNADARTVLSTAVSSAARGGWVRPFLEAGESMLSMLESLAHKERTFVARVLSAGKKTKAATTASAAAEPAGQALIEPLTDREKSTLTLLTQNLQNKEIAAQLNVSPETVKTHLRHIYGKLGVNRRRQAVARAAELFPELSVPSAPDPANQDIQ